jgi:S1-C subfamily serine protease
MKIRSQTTGATGHVIRTGPLARAYLGSFALLIALLAPQRVESQPAPQPRLPSCPTDTSTSWNQCFGVRVFPSGARYEGEFRANNYHGRGTFSFPSGQKYVGEYRDGKRTGYGTYTFPNGEKYVGSFLDGKYHGLGTLTFADGGVHYGEWREDQRNGKGTYVTPDGRRFVGEYVDGKRNGPGIQYNRQGAILQSGRWEHGQLVQAGPVDTNAYPFVMAGSPAATTADAARADRERQAADSQIQAERQRRQELERELAEERRKRAEAESRGVTEPAGSTGTGFAIAPGFIITNQHVIEGCQRPEIHSLDGRRVGAVIDSDDIVDLALIRVTGLAGGIAALRRPGSVRLGEPAYAFGFPLSGMLTEDGNFTNGVVSALKGLRNSANEFQITTPVQPGNSGGAVIDSAGNVIGVVVSKLNAAAIAKLTGDIPQNVNFAVSLQALVDFLGRNRVSFRNADRNTPMDTAQIAESTRAFTHRIVCPESSAQAPRRGAPPPQASAPRNAPPPAAPPPDTTVLLKNQSRESIFAIHVSPVSSDSWGPDLLGSEVLSSGKQFKLQPPVSQGCRFDVLVEFESGKKQERRDQNFCELVELDFDGR